MAPVTVAFNGMGRIGTISRLYDVLCIVPCRFTWATSALYSGPSRTTGGVLQKATPECPSLSACILPNDARLRRSGVTQSPVNDMKHQRRWH
jgi:hypothetical protein